MYTTASSRVHVPPADEPRRGDRLLGEDSRPIAGGHSLLPIMKLRLATPAALVDIGRVPGLDGISQENGGLRSVHSRPTRRSQARR